MSQGVTKRHPTRGSLRGHEDPRTVLLRMAQDDERAKRIRALKDNRPDLTWHDIAEKVGVSERSAIDWQKTGGISHDNCKKLAKVFGVDQDWLWSGRTESAPDLMGALRNDVSQLDRIEAELARQGQLLDELLSRLPEEGLAAALEAEAAQDAAQQERSAAAPPRKTPRRKAS
jgi:transcriptional regulator with XRE-family HTH domain